MEGYYDPWPLVILERPITLSGFYGCEDGKVAWSTAARLGLNLVHVSRLVEHQAGTTEAAIIADEGYEGWHRRCRVVLRSTLPQQPPGIWTLGPNVLMDPVCAGLIHNQSRHIHLRQSAAERFAKVAAILDMNPTRFLPWLAPSMLLTEQFELMWSQRVTGYERAEIQIDCEQHHHSKTADRVIELLQQG
ncbi:MAG TPA: hypothetical protein DCQ06_01805 [Myxococcales bacterium]|nr:hypothetical protein [Myxococcales bacterium]HAN30309.1 hypothetical protein [Myxococcales bacterium]